MIATSRPPAMNCEDCGREIGEREFHIILILSTKLAGWLVCCECARQVEPGKGAEDEALACSRAKAAAHLLGWEPPEGEGGLRAQGPATTMVAAYGTGSGIYEARGRVAGYDFPSSPIDLALI